MNNAALLAFYFITILQVGILQETPALGMHAILASENPMKVATSRSTIQLCNYYFGEGQR